MDTLKESFIEMNKTKIITKIKNAFKDRFFYKKQDLIAVINMPKPYPLVQIYSAMTSLMEDKNEMLMDKYGRSGSFVNIGDYYLFQPNELVNPFLSIYDRSVPIDFKQKSIPWQTKVEVEAQTKVEVEAVKEQEAQTKVEAAPLQEALTLTQQLHEKYNWALQTFRDASLTVKRGDDNWYKHAGVSMRKLKAMFGIPDELLVQMLVEHIVDLLNYEEKRELLSLLYSPDKRSDMRSNDELMTMIKTYIESQWIQIKNLKMIALYSAPTQKHIVLLDPQRGVVDAQPEDIRDYEIYMKNKDMDKRGAMHSIVGFIGFENNNQYLVFKLKQTAQKRNTGARCDEAVKSRKVQMLNDIFDEKDKFVERVISEEEKARGIVSTKSLVQAELCSFMEFVLRYYQHIGKHEKQWFITSV
jgi:hypothetical protein